MLNAGRLAAASAAKTSRMIPFVLYKFTSEAEKKGERQDDGGGSEREREKERKGNTKSSYITVYSLQ